MKIYMLSTIDQYTAPDKGSSYRILKYIIIGEAGTGKSSLAACYTTPNYRLDESKSSTIGVDFYSKTTEINNKTIKIYIWDTAGQEKFRSITHSYYRGAMGAIIVFSLCSRESFSKVPSFIESVNTYSKDIPISLVGTFNDKDHDHFLSEKEIMSFASRNDLKFFKVSCLTKEGIDDVFSDMNIRVCKILDSESENESKHINQNSYKLQPECKGGWKCC